MADEGKEKGGVKCSAIDAGADAATSAFNYACESNKQTIPSHYFRYVRTFDPRSGPCFGRLYAPGSLTKWLRGPPTRGRSVRARDTTFVGPCVLNSPYISLIREAPQPIP